MDRREEYKQKLIKRLRGRKEEGVEEPDFDLDQIDPTDDLVDADLPDEEEDATWGFLEPLPEEEPEPVSFITEESLSTFYEEGYTAFINGVLKVENPITDLMEGINDEEKEILTSVWEDGWETARKDQLMADVILSAREVVESDDDEIVEEMFTFLTERVKDLSEVIDLVSYEQFWWPEV